MVCYKCGEFKKKIYIRGSNNYKDYVMRTAKYDREKEILEKQLKKDKYEYFDWMNGWKETPLEVKKCNNLHHIKQDKQLSYSGSCNLVYCEICKYYYNYDCS